MGTATGRCLCGAIRYVVEGDPLWCAHCHCGSCRRNTGSAVATFVGFDKGAFSLVAGELTAFASSPGVTRSFCGACGTPVSFESEMFPGEIHLFIGALEHPEHYEPQFHAFYQHRLPWLHIADSAPRFDTLPDEGTD